MRKTSAEMNQHFELINDTSSVNTTKIKLSHEDFKDIVYHYRTVNIPEENGDGSATLKFEYDIDENPNDIAITNFNTPIFEKLLGDILVAIILEYEQEFDGETGNEDIITLGE